MKLLKGALAAILVASMTACSTQSSKQEKKGSKKEEPIKTLAPIGVPSLSLPGLYGNQNIAIDTVDGTDVLHVQLAKKGGEYDAIIAPTNLGAALLSKDKSAYPLDSVVIWGNLCIIGSDEADLQREGVFVAFGEEAVPQKVLESSMDLSSFTPETRYFNSANEVQAQLLSKKAAIGLLTEPAATATIAKAKEKGIGLKVLKDLQKEYKTANNMEQNGYPQAALFIKKGSEEKVVAYRKETKAFVKKADDTSTAGAVETATVEKSGIPSVQIVQKIWRHQSVRFEKTTDVQKDIALFLKQLAITLKDSTYTK